MAQVSVKIEQSAKELIQAYADSKGLTLVDAITQIANNLPKDDSSAESKLLFIFNAIGKYNEAEKKARTKRYFVPTAYLINKLAGLNITRDIVPFVKANADLITKQLVGVGIKAEIIDGKITTHDFIWHSDVEKNKAEVFKQITGGKFAK